LMRGRAEAARRAHNPEVAGSNPVPAIKHSFGSAFLLGNRHALLGKGS
jgi:hypothetical protein